MTLPASDGLILRGTLTYPKGAAGRRSPLAVLAHQYPSTRDCFAPLVADLLSAGYATLAFDTRGHGQSTRVATGDAVSIKVIATPRGLALSDFGEAFVASANSVRFHLIADDIVRVASWGASQNFIDGSRLLLCGGSVGGTGVLLAAPRLSAALIGVLTVGAAGAQAHGDAAAATIRDNCLATTVPFLLASSQNDPFDGATNVRTWSEGAPNVTALVVGGEGHAMAIYYQVRSRVVGFARSCLRPAVRKSRRSPAKRK